MRDAVTGKRSMAGLVALAAVVLLWQWLGLGELLEYRRELLAGQPWRLLSAHLVHLSWAHALVNAGALLLLGRLIGPWQAPWQQWLTLALAAPAISLVLWAALPELDWYRGLSGVLHAWFFAGFLGWAAAARGSARLLPVAALLAGAAKVLAEQPWDNAVFPHAHWLDAAVVPQAHLAGAVVGIALGLSFLLGSRGAAAR